MQGLDARLKGRHGDRGVVSQRPDCFVDHLGIDQRFVTLNINHNVGIAPFRHFRQTVGTGFMIHACHLRPTAERPDCSDNPFVIGGNDYLGNQCGTRGSLIDMLHHRLAHYIGKSFSCESGGSVTCGDYGGYFHGNNGPSSK